MVVVARNDVLNIYLNISINADGFIIDQSRNEL